MNRDPIGEYGGVAVYGFARNAGSLLADPFGLTWETSDKDRSKWEAGKGPFYCAKDGGETFEQLINQINADFPGTSAAIDDWMCLWPTKKRSEPMYTGAPNTAAPRGARFDAANVVGNDTTTNLSFVVAEAARWKRVANVIRNHVKVAEGDGYLQAIRHAAGDGTSPITYMAVVGHHIQGDPDIWGNEGATFDVSALAAALPPAAQTYEAAKDRKGPSRCWFSRRAQVRFVACHTADGVAPPFASNVLRTGATAWGTDDRLWLSEDDKAFFSADPGVLFPNAAAFYSSPHWKASGGGL